jgi:enoyl-[acyl-carrier protein] reductase I
MDMQAVKGKKIVILGVANERSIGYGILKSLKENGAEIALTYVNEAIEKRVRPIAQEFGIETVLQCDVADDAQIANLASEIKNRWGTVDGLVHSVAYADRNDLAGAFYSTSREGFRMALDISAYSLVALASAFKPLMDEKGGSIITLSYYGAEKVVPKYNVMGVAKAALEASVRYLAYDLGPNNIRVNAISAGPIKTLAASGISEFKTMLAAAAEKAPLKRNITLDDVGNSALYLLSDLGSGLTGEVMHLDCGYSIMGM